MWLVLLCCILVVMGGLGWLVLGALNTRAQDGYLSFFSEMCDSFCAPVPANCKVRSRNMYMSRWLAAFNCPLLGWRNWGPKHVNAACAQKDRAGHFTWMHFLACLGLLSAGCGGLVVLLKRSGTPVNQWLFTGAWLVFILSMAGLLEVPFGVDDFSENHTSWRLHDRTAGLALVSLLASLIVLALALQPTEAWPLYLIVLLSSISLISAAAAESKVDQAGTDAHRCQYPRYNLIFQFGEILAATLPLTGFLYVGALVAQKDAVS